MFLFLTLFLFLSVSDNMRRNISLTLSEHMSAKNLVEQATVSDLELLDIPSISRIPSKTPVFNISNCNVTINNNLLKLVVVYCYITV